MPQPGAVAAGLQEGRALAQAVVPAIAEISPTFRAAMAAVGIIAAGSNELSGANQNEAVESAAAGLTTKEFLNAYKNDTAKVAGPEQVRNFLSTCAEHGVEMSEELKIFLSRCAVQGVNVPYGILVACVENPDIILENRLYNRLAGKFGIGQPVPNEIFIKVMNSVLGVEDAVLPTVPGKSAEARSAKAESLAFSQITSQAEVDGIRAAQMGLMDDLFGGDGGGYDSPDLRGNAAPDPEDPMSERIRALSERREIASQKESECLDRLGEQETEVSELMSEVEAWDKRLKKVNTEVNETNARVAKMNKEIADVNVGRRNTSADKELEQSLNNLQKGSAKAREDITKADTYRDTTNKGWNEAIKDTNNVKDASSTAYINREMAATNAGNAKNTLSGAQQYFNEIIQDPKISFLAKQNAEMQLLIVQENALNALESNVKALEEHVSIAEDLISAQDRMIEAGRAKISATQDSINARKDLMNSSEEQMKAVKEWVEAVENTPLPKESLVARFWHLLGW